MGKVERPIAEETRSVLLDYAWPGNVRELENAIERAMVIGKGPRIVPSDLPLRVEQGGDRPADLSLEAVEEAHIRRVIGESEGNVTHAARTLGIDRGTLYNKMRRYRIERPR